MPPEATRRQLTYIYTRASFDSINFVNTFFFFWKKKKNQKENLHAIGGSFCKKNQKHIIFNETGIYSTEGRIYALLNIIISTEGRYYNILILNNIETTIKYATEGSIFDLLNK